MRPSSTPPNSRHGALAPIQGWMVIPEADAPTATLPENRVTLFLLLGSDRVLSHQVFRPAADAAVGRRRPPAANIGGIAAHCCGFFSCTNPPVWLVGGVVVAVTAFLAILHQIMVFQRFSLFCRVF